MKRTLELTVTIDTTKAKTALQELAASFYQQGYCITWDKRQMIGAQR